MKTLKLMLLLSLPLQFFQCHYDQFVWMQYIETKCADPWQTNESDPETVVMEAAEDYFLNNDVNICEITMDFNEAYAEACEACICTTGRIIHVKVNESFIDELEAEGFIVE